MPFKYNPYEWEFDWVLGPGSGTATVEFTTDSGDANPDGDGVITIAGGTGISTSGTGSTVTIDGVVVQAVQSVLNSSGSTTSTIPYDDTAPQNTEGAEWDTITITPTSASNILRIRFASNMQHGGSGGATHTIALFQDSTADALAAACQIAANTGNNDRHYWQLEYSMTAGTTNSTTFKIRYGNNGAGTFTTYMNRQVGSAGPVYGTAGVTVFEVEEISV